MSNKQDMQRDIGENYNGIERMVLLAQLDFIKSGKFYGWMHDGKKMMLLNHKGDYTIREAY